MRLSGATKSGEFNSVVFATNATMDFFAAPSFHDGRGSAANACAVGARQAHAIAVMNRVRNDVMDMVVTPTLVSATELAGASTQEIGRPLRAARGHLRCLL